MSSGYAKIGLIYTHKLTRKLCRTKCFRMKWKFTRKKIFLHFCRLCELLIIWVKYQSNSFYLKSTVVSQSWAFFDSRTKPKTRPRGRFSNFCKNLTKKNFLELLNMLFRNSPIGGFFWWNKIHFDFFELSQGSRWLAKSALKAN